MWFEEASAVYFNLIEKYRDRIIIEIAGHDHFTDLRYKSSETADPYFYHNLLIAPSVTPWYNNNPGVAAFEVDENLKPFNLKQSNLNLDATIGRE